MTITTHHRLTPAGNVSVEVVEDGRGIVASAIFGPIATVNRLVDAWQGDTTRMWRSPVTVRV